MNTVRVSQRAYRDALSFRPSRPVRWFALSCEPLEARQLLSVLAAAGPESNPASQIVAAPSLLFVNPFPGGGHGGGGGGGTPPGYNPLQLQTAYGISTGSGYNSNISFNGVKGDGTGQTIAIVDAYNDPKISSDLQTFSIKFGLPSATFAVDNLGGSTSNAGWALETALDVEWAHAVAPGASLVLVEAASSSFTDMFNAVQAAVQNDHASVVSMSWGAGEFSGETSYDTYFQGTGVTYVASSGDSGTVEYPSASPYVLSVGGTTLSLNSHGTWMSETAWSGSGGGPSTQESEPAYQDLVQSSGKRTTPDVAWNADPNTGVAVYSSVRYYGQSGWFQVGGTSAAAPAWAGVMAIADQGHNTAMTGYTQTLPALYSSTSSSYHDIITGSNGYYSAGSGYDLVTGLGSPKANSLISALTGAAPAIATTTTSATSTTITISSHGARSHDDPTITSGFTGISSANSANSISTTEITPLTTAILTGSAANHRLVIVVIVVPQPLPVNLGSSAEPATTQAILATALLEEAPTTPTHFGQGGIPEPVSLLPKNVIPVKRPAGAPIDVVEPFQVPEGEPARPGEAPPAPAPGPGAGPVRAWPLPISGDPVVESVLNLTDEELMPGTSHGSQEGGPTWVPSTTLFSVAALAVGGYHLVLRQNDRFRGRWVPGRSRTRRLAAGRRLPGRP